jgi:hypothetical protein
MRNVVDVYRHCLLLQGRRISRESGNWYGYREKEDCALSEPIRASKTMELLLYPEDGGSRLFQNVGKHLSEYM